MKLIVGLGNPGKKYEKTRHNVGFRVVDERAKELGLKFSFQKKLLAEIAKQDELILAKPQTFMNDSGKALKKLATSYKLPATSLLVIHDDVDLSFGKIRFSQNSGSAGHKGVESVIAAIGPGFTRLRIGIENREAYRKPDTETYVLKNFTAEEEKMLRETVVTEAIRKIQQFVNS